jgi:hypothetical protein
MKQLHAVSKWMLSLFCQRVDIHPLEEPTEGPLDIVLVNEARHCRSRGPSTYKGSCGSIMSSAGCMYIRSTAGTNIAQRKAKSRGVTGRLAPCSLHRLQQPVALHDIQHLCSEEGAGAQGFGFEFRRIQIWRAR